MSDAPGLREQTSGPARLLPQRERIQESALELIGSSGYAAVTVAQIARHARVSSATFYKLFSGKQECFLASYESVARELTARIRQAIAERAPIPAWQATLDAILAFAAERPDALMLLSDEAMVAGPAAVRERARLLEEIEQVIEASPGKPLGLPAKALTGPLFRLYALREGADRGDVLAELRDGLTTWLHGYDRPSSLGPRWGLTPIPRIVAGPPTLVAGLVPPQRGPRGRSRQTPEQIANNQRERIMHAVAELTLSKGYAETTVADIVAEAGLAREIFYQHYRDKENAFLDAHRFVFQTLMALCAQAFFSAEEWPERVWAALRAAADFMVNFPAFAHVVIVEADGTESRASLLRERVMAFTIFLEEGYRQDSRAKDLPALTSEAIATAMFEIAYEAMRTRGEQDFPGLLPLMAFLSLAPFLGIERAEQFARDKAEEAQRIAES